MFSQLLVLLLERLIECPRLKKSELLVNCFQQKYGGDLLNIVRKGIYRHFKGGLYEVIGVSHPIKEPESKIKYSAVASGVVHTEDPELKIDVFEREGHYFHSKEISGDVLVFYSPCHTDTNNNYLRPIESFLGCVDCIKYPNADQFLRFSYVGKV